MSTQPVFETLCPACGQATLAISLEVTDHSVSKESFRILACPACGLRRTDPQPPAGAIGRYYASQDYVSHSDTRAGLVNRMYHLARRFMLGRKAARVRAASGRSTGRLLDVGAGTGYFAAHMRDLGWDVTALEPDEGARSAAMKRAGLEIRPLEQLAELPAGQFDVITLWHVLEHVYEPWDYLRRFHALLAPGGTLVIAVPNPDSRDARVYGLWWAAWDVPRHLWHFSAGAMQHLLARERFRQAALHTMPLDAFYVSMLSEKYQGRGVTGLIRGAWNGCLTWLASLGKATAASSLVYVARKK